MNTNELQAGREMDALIAERVMGWENIHFDNNGNCFGKPPKDFYQQCPVHEIPHFSTMINSAWKVAEKMGMPFYIIKCYNPATFPGEMEKGWLTNWCKVGDCICVNPDHEGFCPNGNEIWAESAPLAICRGALIRGGISQ